MKRTHRALMLLCLGVFLQSACKQQHADNSATPSDPTSPAYGPVIPLKGTAMMVLESDDIYLCHQSRQQCLRDYRTERCRVWRTDAASKQLDQLLHLREREIDGYGPAIGEFWLEGSGRIARERINIGNMAVDDCQVELTDIRVADDKPPYRFMPPPP